MDQLAREIVELSPDVRHVTISRGGALTTAARPIGARVPAAGAVETEELLVNPALLLLALHHGTIAGEALRYLVIRYHDRHQLLVPIRGGHLSVALDPEGRPGDLGEAIQHLLGRMELLVHAPGA